jgi:hypothetical protein
MIGEKMRNNSMPCWIALGLLAASTATYTDDQTITLRDWTGRGFAPEVIGYDVLWWSTERLSGKFLAENRHGSPTRKRGMGVEARRASEEWAS